MPICSTTIFTTALCNLNCKYCYICKDSNGGLEIIDNDLKQDFDNLSQIQQVLNYGNNIQNTLTDICIWGGEPFLHLDRFYNQIDKWFDTFPNITSFMTSTNFTLSNEINELSILLDKINELGPQKEYEFTLQISIDGYPEMNDYSRGPNVTKAILNNFNKLLLLKYNYNKIKLKVQIKPTLSRETFQFLNSKDKCEQWFKFFNDKMYLPYKEAKAPFHFSLYYFNCATPTEWTKEDGIEYAKIIKNLSLIDIQKYEGWKHFPCAVPMVDRIAQYIINGNNYEHQVCGGTCSAFHSCLVPIPHNKYTVCHRGLFDNYIEYCNTTNSRDYMNGLSKKYFAADDRNRWIYTLDEFKNINQSLSYLQTCPNQIRATDLIIFIREYARLNIIDKKYLNLENIKPTLPYFLEIPYCMQDSFIQHGSWTTTSTHEIPLLYNGAMDIIISEVEKYLQTFEREENINE